MQLPSYSTPFQHNHACIQLVHQQLQQVRLPSYSIIRIMSIQLFYNSAVSSGPFWAADCKDSIDSEHLVPHAKIPHEPIAFQSTHKKHIMLDVFAVSSCHVTNSYKPHACKLEMIPKFNLQLLVRVFHQQVHPAVYEWFRSLKTTRPCISIPNIRPVHSLMHTLYSALLDS